MAHFRNQDICLSIVNSNSRNENTEPNKSILMDEINRPLSTRHNRKMSIDDINANRPRMNSFPVPPLPQDETTDDEYFDAECRLKYHLYFIENFTCVCVFKFSSYRRSINIVSITRSQTSN